MTKSIYYVKVTNNFLQCSEGALEWSSQTASGHHTAYTVRQLEQDVLLIIIIVQFILHHKAWVDERSHHAPIPTYKFQWLLML